MPNKPTKKPGLEPKTRDRIIAAAKQTFAEDGYQPGSMSRIARRAGVDKSSLYYFFKNKEDLFAAVTLNTWEELSKLVVENLAGPNEKSPQELLSKTCQEFIRASLAAGMATTRMELPKCDHPLFHKTIRGIQSITRHGIAFLKKHGAKQPVVAHSLLSNAIHAYVLHTCTGKEQPSIKTYCDYLASITLPTK